MPGKKSPFSHREMARILFKTSALSNNKITLIPTWLKIEAYSVQRILRQSSSKVTEKYAHLSTRSLQDASDTISEQLLRAASGEN